MYIETIKHARSELDNLKNILSDFTQRTASLLTFAGLIVLLPSLIEYPSVYVFHFLKWTFPFLFISIILFILTSMRKNNTIKSLCIYYPNTIEELLGLKNQAFGFNENYKENYEFYLLIVRGYRLTNFLLYSYIFSFVINFYISIFLRIPNFYQSLYTLMLSLALSTFFVRIGPIFSRKNVSYSVK